MERPTAAYLSQVEVLEVEVGFVSRLYLFWAVTIWEVRIDIYAGSYGELAMLLPN